jgi:hypothetical protein
VIEAAGGVGGRPSRGDRASWRENRAEEGGADPLLLDCPSRPRAPAFASELGREKRRGMCVSQATVWRVLRRHRLSSLRAALLARGGLSGAPEPPREPAAASHRGRASRGARRNGPSLPWAPQRTKGAVWQLTAIHVQSSFAWAELVRSPKGHHRGANLQAGRSGWRQSSARPAGGSSGSSRTTGPEERGEPSRECRHISETSTLGHDGHAGDRRRRLCASRPLRNVSSRCQRRSCRRFALPCAGSALPVPGVKNFQCALLDGARARPAKASAVVVRSHVGAGA